MSGIPHERANKVAAQKASKSLKTQMKLVGTVLAKQNVTKLETLLKTPWILHDQM